MGKTDTEVQKTMSGFQFSAVDMGELEASDEYTIVNILVDETYSVGDFKSELEQCVGQIVDACKKSPRSENLLLRVASFSSKGSDNVREMHGFNILSNINTDDYKGKINPDGMTPLLDATLDSIETIEAQAKALDSQDYRSNAVFFVITDGGENSSNNATYKKNKRSVCENQKRRKGGIYPIFSTRCKRC